jgi:hypothetical protein
MTLASRGCASKSASASALRFKPKSDEVVEVPIRQSFNVEESWGAA